MLPRRHRPRPTARSSNYRVPDLQAAYEVLAGRGIVFEAGPHLIAKLPDHELWMAFFRDPDENLLALMGEVRE